MGITGVKDVKNDQAPFQNLLVEPEGEVAISFAVWMIKDELS